MTPEKFDVVILGGGNAGIGVTGPVRRAGQRESHRQIPFSQSWLWCVRAVSGAALEGGAE